MPGRPDPTIQGGPDLTNIRSGKTVPAETVPRHSDDLTARIPRMPRQFVRFPFDAATRQLENGSMSTISIAQPIQDLICYLETLNERAPVEELRRFLSELDVTIDDLRPFMHFGEKTYRRNLIREGKWYELLCICWRSGQRSPIHNHAGSTCGLRIMQGIATETRFELTPCGQIKAVDSTDFAEGFVCSSQDEDIHQVSNLQPPGKDLVTLHIYSPALKTMDTFSLFSSERELYQPRNETIYVELGDCI